MLAVKEVEPAKSAAAARSPNLLNTLFLMRGLKYIGGRTALPDGLGRQSTYRSSPADYRRSLLGRRLVQIRWLDILTQAAKLLGHAHLATGAWQDILPPNLPLSDDRSPAVLKLTHYSNRQPQVRTCFLVVAA